LTMARARDNVRLVGAARELASHIEKARLDSIRRHELGGQAVVTLTGTNTYSVLMDFGGSGAPVTRSFTLPDGVRFTDDPLPPAITFNWRGRTTADTRITLRNSQGEEEVVSVTIGGEVSVGREQIVLAAPGSTPFPAGSGLNSSIPTNTTSGSTTTTTTGTTGSATGGSATGDGSATGGSATGGSATGSTPTCAISAASSSMDVKKDKSEKIAVTITGSTSVSASSDNASVTVSLHSISGNTYTYTISSINGYKNYTATVTFAAGCDLSVKASVDVNVTP